MKNNLIKGSTLRVGRIAAVAGVASLLLAGVLEVPAGAAASPPYATTTTVTSSVASPVTGQAITFTATVRADSAPAGLRKGIGEVAFTITAPDATVINCDAGNTPMLSNGTAQCAVSAGLLSNATAYSVSAVYTDTVDSNYVTSNTTLLETVAPGATSTTLTASDNPTVTGQPVTFTATVAPVAPATGTLTGSVKFSGISHYGTCVGGSNTVPVVAGVAQCTLANGLPASVSPLTVTGTYGNDPYFAGSSSPYVQKIHRASATLNLAFSPDNCTGNYCTTDEGTPLTITVTAAPVAPSIVDPTGPVVITILPAGSNTSLACQEGNSLTLTAGQATCTLPNGVPAVVYYTVTASLEDPNYVPVSASLYLNSALGSTNTVLGVPSQLGAGATIPVTATVTAVGTSLIAPTGKVAFSVCSDTTHACQGTAAAVQTDGKATLKVRGGEFPGGYKVYAHYLGDQNFYASTAISNTLTIVKSDTNISLLPTENPSLDGDGVTVTATVKGANGSSKSTLIGPPTGTMTFVITGPSGNLTCADGNVVKLKKNSTTPGEVTCYLPPGTLTDPAAPDSTDYSVSVSYTGDSNYNPSTGTYTQTVVPPVS